MASAAIIVDGIRKQYGPVVALQPTHLTVEGGEIFGLIGPDGAGKTSLIRILTTVLSADGGRATVDGLDVVADFRTIRQRVGYMPGRFSLYQDLSVIENLEFFAAIFGTTVEENYALIKDIYVQIEPFKHRLAGQLSGGMKQKLALSCALIHRPRVLFLDEPTTGVDPVSRREFWEMLGRLRAHGITILVSTPYMDEARRCDRVALMQGGRILCIDTPSAITASYTKPLLAVRARERFRLIGDLRAYPHAASVFPFGDTVHYSDARSQLTPADIATLHHYLQERGHAQVHIEAIAAGIEDSFMDLMGSQDSAA